ncbi:MAG: hypothetical protein IJV41_11375 [Oscillospiraceae bacterium]|nr:hypothetical protein [Oscillospiraceae bacterium]
MAEKRKRGTRAYVILLLLFSLLILAVGAYVLLQIWDFAEQYEYSRPSRTVNAYLETLNRDLWNDSMEAAIADVSRETQSDEEIKAFIQDRLKGGITAVRRGTNSSGSINYALRSDGREIGTLTIAEDTGYRGKIDMHQWPWNKLTLRTYPWYVEGDSFHFDDIYSSVSVTVPSDYSVLVNGVKLGSEYIVEDGIYYDCFSEYYYYWDYLPTKVRYEYNEVIGEAEVVILDADGNETTIDPDAGDIQFVEQFSGWELQRYIDFCEPFTERYLIYTSGLSDRAESNYFALQPYLQPNSDLYARMWDALDGLTWGHTSSTNVGEVTVNSVLPLVDGYALCDVSAEVDTFAIGKGEESRTTRFKLVTYDDGEQILAAALDLY